MKKLPASRAATALLRALLGRGQCERDRILLIDSQSIDWQSLTFVGERHELTLRVCGPEARAIAARIADGLEDAEFSLPALLVADIGLDGAPKVMPDGSIELSIAALTLEEA